MNFIKMPRMLLTKNLVPGKKVYDEFIEYVQGVEYRVWNPKKSKLGAAIVKGLDNFHMDEGSVVLYLGASSGTTCSHVSDIVGKTGFVFALDFAPRVVRDLVYVCESRKNMAPLLADASNPESYQGFVTEADVIFQDIAQKNQSEIFLKNINYFLKKDGFAMLAVKARCIDVSKRPAVVFETVRKELEKEVRVLKQISLEPFERDHCLFVVQKK